jgi:hypothetical protein
MPKRTQSMQPDAVIRSNPADFEPVQALCCLLQAQFIGIREICPADYRRKAIGTR